MDFLSHSFRKGLNLFFVFQFRDFQLVQPMLILLWHQTEEIDPLAWRNKSFDPADIFLYSPRFLRQIADLCDMF